MRLHEKLAALREGPASLWDWIMLAGNVTLFVPFGALIGMTGHARSGRDALLLGAGLSLLIECLQYAVGRTFDLSDILLNGIGAWFGWYGCQLIQIHHKKERTT